MVFESFALFPFSEHWTADTGEDLDISCLEDGELFPFIHPLGSLGKPNDWWEFGAQFWGASGCIHTAGLDAQSYIFIFCLGMVSHYCNLNLILVWIVYDRNQNEDKLFNGSVERSWYTLKHCCAD